MTRIYELTFKLQNISGKIIFDEPVTLDLAGRLFHDYGAEEIEITKMQEAVKVKQMDSPMDFRGLWRTDKGQFVDIFMQSGNQWIGNVMNSGGDRIGIASFNNNGENEEVGKLMAKRRGSEDTKYQWPRLNLMNQQE